MFVYALCPIKWCRSIRVGLLLISCMYLLTENALGTTEQLGDNNNASSESRSERLNHIGMKFHLIPAGSFLMGFSDDINLSGDRERPQHKVNISKPFYMGTTEVTQEQWNKVMGSPIMPIESDEKIGPDLPVRNASWNDAMAFVEKLSKQDPDHNYRLPTEAEWEYACRAGTTTRFFWGKDTNKRDYKSYMWCNLNSEQTQPVAKLKPNPWGLYDMNGNVMEWCSDWFTKYTPEEQTDPAGPQEGKYRVLRGGAYGNRFKYCRSATRIRLSPDKSQHGYGGCGFRVVAVPVIPGPSKTTTNG